MKILATLLAALAIVAPAAAPAREVPAWSASQQPVWGSGFLFPTNIPPNLGGAALRQVVRLSYGGRGVRILLSNAYGRAPVTIAGAHLAPSLGGSRIDTAHGAWLRFGGAEAATIPAGGAIVSDLTPLPVSAGDDLAVTLRFGTAPTVGGFHWDGKRTGYVIAGDAMAAADPRAAETTTARLFLASILVDAPDAKGTIVVMGDSITDGAGATLDAEARWPDFLAGRAAPLGYSVVNAGISGARLLSDGMGDSALARFDRDVLAVPGVRAVVLLLGINDIAWPGTPFAPNDPPARLDAMVAGYRAFVERAHASDIRVIAGTLTPFAGALPGTPLATSYYSPSKDLLREQVNAWIRNSGTFDAVVDFDLALRDRNRPRQLAAPFDSSDRLHPGDAGNRAMADTFDFGALRQTGTRGAPSQ